VVIAYLLDGAIEVLKRYAIPRFAAVLLVFCIFIFLLLLVLVILAPLLFKQLTQFALEIPGMLAAGQGALLLLPEKYPTLLSEQTIVELLNSLRNELTQLSRQVLSFSLSSVFNLIAFIVYLVVVPLLVFFFLKDKALILDWFGNFLPRDRELVIQIWREVNAKIAGYVRGKFVEILTVWAVTFVTFLAFGLRYSMLLSFLVGISVLIPYVGAAVVTLPVAAIAYVQWGMEATFVYVMLAYAIIQFLDGNLLVPLLFAEMVNLHPAAIITAVLFFGAIWGVWGVFFAIPLATLVNAVINAWPRQHGQMVPPQ
ncbi:MAG: AI-2E family transporter, partial [Thiothrix sp.]